ncbi:MAG TPA: 16S rRNA (cytosine(1402)-N(4))-methyltransferase RsmH [Dehalococcoidia bacterium]
MGAAPHTPVMVEEVLRALNVQPGGRYVDCTVGAGGHAAAVLEAASPGGLLLGLDADPGALRLAGARLAPHGDSVRLVQANFRDVARVCHQYNFAPVHGILFDLGLSSMQLAEERGFSFQVEAPLDMRFGPDQALTADEIVNTWPEDRLADLLWRFGEEPLSRRIARQIVRSRPIRTTTQLAKAVEQAAGGARKRIHPATKTFQALRIAVNQELDNLIEALEASRGLLGFGGRVVVISFHSLEDRIVKQFFRREAQGCVCPPRTPVCTCGHRPTLKPVTKGAVTPSPAEIAANPRARSARLRAAERI